MRNVAAVVYSVGADKGARVVGPDKIKPGDTVVVPSARGGADKFGWNPESTNPVVDVAEACLAQLIASYPPNAYRQPKVRLRLHRSLIDASGVDQPVKEKLQGLLRSVLTSAKTEDADIWPPAQHFLLTLMEHMSDAAHSAAIMAVLEMKKKPKIESYPQRQGVVVIGAVQVPDQQAAPMEDIEYEVSEGDENSFALGGQKVLLARHTQGVQKKVTEFASFCDLGDFEKVLALAARWHDEGKRDPRFQAWLQGSELKALSRAGG